MARLTWKSSAFAKIVIGGWSRVVCILSLNILSKCREYPTESLQFQKIILQLIKNKHDLIIVRKVFALSSFLCRSSRVNQLSPAARPNIPLFLSWGTRQDICRFLTFSWILVGFARKSQIRKPPRTRN